MPTGYTADLYDGKATTTAEFLRNCAPAFDGPSGRGGMPLAPIAPDTEYHDKAIAKAHDDLLKFQAWGLTEAEEAAEAEFQSDLARMNETAEKRLELRARYEAVLAGVRAWRAPTELHEGLREFAIKQLVESIDFDCGMKFWPEPKRWAGSEWRDECIGKAKRDIEYHTAEREKAIQRTKDRNEWVTALLDSLPAEEVIPHAV